MSKLQRAKDAKSKNCDFPIGAKRRAASPEWSHLWWSKTPHGKKKSSDKGLCRIRFCQNRSKSSGLRRSWNSWLSFTLVEQGPPRAQASVCFGSVNGKNEMHLGNCRKKEFIISSIFDRNPSSSCLMLLPWSTKMLLSVKATASSTHCKITRRGRNPRNLQIRRISKKLRCCTSGIRLVVNLMECTPWHPWIWCEAFSAKQCSCAAMLWYFRHCDNL